MGLPERPRVVITGAGSGLGRALSVELARRRGRVVVSDVNEDAARETARGVEREGGEARVVRCDVTKPEQVEALARESRAAFGGVDLLVNNAGVAGAGEVGKLPLAEWKFVLDVNLWGVIHGCHYFVPLLREQGRGHILNIASAAGLLSAPYLAPYNVSKAAVVALSETLLAELKEAGIGVSVACPMFFRTNIAASAHIVEDEAGRRLKELASTLVEGAAVEADDVARDCVRGVEHGAFYVLPMASGRWAWRLKRLSPEVFVRGGNLIQKHVLERLARRR
ncbi:SDR family NAD(P)-dependent oxidoreductase [Vitiosangium sp. GDMCC 1.1324]|uniref:SDR family NAD(P)-dependent oxidoreductase n=1 Tax=Vitiosangium sp. (strain GDMCC 1.1324) TaxID=2138576 RepID=UPI000D3A9569|nr:SDR family NAD(P)-dependent oxidoreductase [Vitiosangium sp. GDMCC 1.1324]PTL84981.1 short-chain dehydrogenase [Vitiosangium sp. GDMCC 1.1324]